MRWVIPLILCLLTSPLVSGQEFIFQGKVYDKGNGMPIPYVNLSFLNTLKGTSTDESGNFSLELPPDFKSRQVHVSALGYQDTILQAGQILLEKGIGLLEESFELEEVVVSEELGNVEILNPITGYSVASGFSSSSTPWIIAVYFDNPDNETGMIDKVTVHLQKNADFKRPASKFRLRIFKTDTSGNPGMDILRKSLILEAPMDADFVVADLAPYKLGMPEEGFYVGLEWLFIPYNWYKSVINDPISRQARVEDRFSPTFAGVYNKANSIRAMVYGMGEWTDFTVFSQDRERVLIPAVSVKLIKE